MLLDAGADPNDQDEDTGSTALHSAIYAIACHSIVNNNREVIQILIDHGADPNREDEKGATPMTLAHERGLMDIVDILTGDNALALLNL